MKKMILPAVFAVLYILFVVIYAIFIVAAVSPLLLKLIVGGLLTITAPVMVYVFVQRLKEFKEEEKDDLSKY